jgi:hypothetical protein
METAGEDPVLVAEFGVALSSGIAGSETTMLAAPAPKHFSCYCGPENWGGIYRWTFDAVVKDKYLTEYFHFGWVRFYHLRPRFSLLSLKLVGPDTVTMRGCCLVVGLCSSV